MFGIGGKHKGRVVAVLDIGSGSVGCALLAVRNHEPSVILATSRVFLPNAERSTEQLITGIAGIIKDAHTAAMASYAASQQKIYGPAREVYCVIRTPWTQSQTRRVEQFFEKSIRVQDSHISELAKKALAQSGVERANLLEASVSEIELSGYPTHSPVGKNTQQITVGVLISTIDQAFRSAVTPAVQAVFPGLDAKWRSHTRAALSLLNKMPEETRDCVLVDISNENTTFVVVRKNLIEGQGQAPEGVRKILERVAPGKPEEETLSMIRMLNHEACSGEACDAIMGAMGKAEPEIVHLFGEVCATLSSVRRLPRHVILLTHTDLAIWLTKILNRVDFAAFTATSLPFQVTTLGGTDLGHWVISDATVVADSGLALSSALVHIESSE